MLAPLLATGPTGRYDHTRDYLAAMQAYAGSGAREAFAATSHVAYDAPGEAAATLIAHASHVPPALREAGISIDALGGRAGALAPSATAFVHRDALATVQYTATWDAAAARPRAADAARSYVSSFRTAMTPAWGEHAYVNYADASLADPGTAYFGANWPRLQQVRTAYDPDGLFSQPQ
jgi:FAD/FMN-containing dehydrogenase